MTLIFLHGAGFTHVVWEQQLLCFDNGLALNLPGHPEGNGLGNVSDLAQWLVCYIEQRNLLDVGLIGHS